MATCQAALARNCALAGRLDEADKLYTSALKILGHPSTSKTFSETRANIVEQRMFVPDYPRVMQIRLEHALTLHLAKRYADAEEAFKKLLKLITDREGKSSLLQVEPLLAFAEHYSERKRPADAEPLLRQRLALLAPSVKPDHPATLTTKFALERACRDLGKTAEADALQQELSAAGFKPPTPK